MKHKNLYIQSISLLFFIVLGTLLRLYHLGSESFWFDELFAVKMAGKLPFDILSGKIAEVSSPPLAWYVLSLFDKLVALNEFTARLPSVIFSVITIPVMYLCGKQINGKDRRMPVLASGFFSISLFSVLWAQEARNYSLFVLLVAVTLYYQLKIIKGNRMAIDWILFFVFSFLGFYTHYMFFVYYIILGTGMLSLFLLKKDWKSSRVLVCGGVITIGLFMLLWGRTNLIPTIFNPIKGYDMDKRLGYPEITIDKPRVDTNAFSGLLLNGLPNLLFGSSVSDINLLMILSLIMLTTVLLVSDEKSGQLTRTAIVFPILLTVVLTEYTTFGKLMNNVYYYIYVVPSVCLMFSYVLARLRNKNVFMGIFVLFLSTSAYSCLVVLSKPHKAEFNKVAEYVSKNVLGASTIYVPEPDVAWALSHYLKDDFKGKVVVSEPGNEFNGDVMVYIRRNWYEPKTDINSMLDLGQTESFIELQLTTLKGTIY